jgi:hypothetical protein
MKSHLSGLQEAWVHKGLTSLSDNCITEIRGRGGNAQSYRVCVDRIGVPKILIS